MRKFFLTAMLAIATLISARCETETVGDYTWTYKIVSGGAQIYNNQSCAVSPKPMGAVDIPSTLGDYPVTSVGHNAFKDCDELTSVTIPSSVTGINGGAFWGCSGLTSFEVDGQNQNYQVVSGLLLTKDGSKLVAGVNGAVTIPSSVTTIGFDAFFGYSGLTSVTIHEGVTNISEMAFYGCSALMTFVVDGQNPNYQSVNGLLLSKDGTQLIAGVNGEVTIPSSVTSIKEYAFSCCSGLTSLTIPSSVKSIGKFAFDGCSELGDGVIICDGCVLTVNGTCPSEISFPSGTRLIADGAFAMCSGLESVTVPSSVTSIGEWAFWECSELASVTIEKGVKNIGDYAFQDCSRLKSVTIPSSVTNVGNSAFSRCSGLTTVTISEGVMIIGDYAFSDCSGLTTVTISEGVMSIGDYAFYGCTALTSLTIPSSVMVIGDYAFCDCRGLTSVSISEGVERINDHAFSGCGGLTSVVIPSSVKSIGEYAFVFCYGLSTVTISEGVTSIGDMAFGFCTWLTSLTIPSSVMNIGQQAFSLCLGLTAVDFEGVPPSGLSSSGLFKEIAVRYNAAFADEWVPVIANCGFTNASSYAPEQRPIDIAFVAPMGRCSLPVATYSTNGRYGRLPDAVRDGFTFAGWYKSLDGTNRVSSFSPVDYSARTLYARWVEEDVSLYAQWEANRYSVVFDANGGEGEMESQSFLYDQIQNLSDGTFTRIGYTFKGWSTSKDGEVAFTDMQSVSNLTAEAGFAVALFAKWEKAVDVTEGDIEEWVGYSLAPKFKKSGETNTQYRKRFEDKFGDDYSVAFFKETGKIGQDGTRLQVWHDYVAGTDPLDAESKFTAIITIEDGVVNVDYSPKFDDQTEANARWYRKWGKVKLTDAKWLEIPSGHEGDYNFFKVTVEMK